MKRVKLDAIPWESWSSPGGRFRGQSREISIALGALRNTPIGQGGHPFDLELGRLAPGFAGCPYHRHSSQWELFLIVSGQGMVRHRGGERAVQPRDVILHPPGAAHQLRNAGNTDLDYLLVADNPRVDLWHYPDSGKWGYRPGGGTFRIEPRAYWDGEDPAAPGTTEPAPGFPWADSVFVASDDIPWELRASPSGRYASHCRDLSLALGGVRDVGPDGGGHPFDLQTRRVPPGAAICPYHSHATQWELFVIVAGTATVRTPEGRTRVGPGEVVLHPPGSPHQTLNEGPEDLVCHIVADHPVADIFHYPDSNKWGWKPGRRFFRITDADYFDGED